MVSRWPPQRAVSEGQHKRDFLVAELSVVGTAGATLRRQPTAGVDGKPDRAPVFGADPVIQLGTAVPSRSVCGGLDKARRYPCVAGLRCHPEIMEISSSWSSFNHLNGGDSDRCSVTLCEQPMGSHHAVSPVLLGLRGFFRVGGEESLGGFLKRGQTDRAVVAPVVLMQYTYGRRSSPVLARHGRLHQASPTRLS
jgi:hypothetical protein